MSDNGSRFTAGRSKEGGFVAGEFNHYTTPQLYSPPPLIKKIKSHPSQRIDSKPNQNHRKTGGEGQLALAKLLETNSTWNKFQKQPAEVCPNRVKKLQLPEKNYGFFDPSPTFELALIRFARQCSLLPRWDICWLLPSSKMHLQRMYRILDRMLRVCVTVWVRLIGKSSAKQKMLANMDPGRAATQPQGDHNDGVESLFASGVQVVIFQIAKIILFRYFRNRAPSIAMPKVWRMV